MVMFKDNKKIYIFIFILALIDVIIFGHITLGYNTSNLRESAKIYFFNVGQGDSSMIDIAGTRFLIDVGRGNKVIYNIEKASSFSFNKYIDVVLLSHPELDHSGGIFNLLKNYKVGLVVYNGEKNKLWVKIERKLKESKINYIALKRGDKILYKNYNFNILWPNKFINFPKSNNDQSMVIRFCSESGCALFMADITSKVEKILQRHSNIEADILKVAHHGSKYSSSLEFLNKVSPKIAIIEVGKNSYGHPTVEAIRRIKSIGAKVFRTDVDGELEILKQSNLLKVFKLSK